MLNIFGQIIVTSTSLQNVAEKGKAPYFREIWVGKYYNLARHMLWNALDIFGYVFIDSPISRLGVS